MKIAKIRITSLVVIILLQCACGRSRFADPFPTSGSGEGTGDGIETTSTGDGDQTGDGDETTTETGGDGDTGGDPPHFDLKGNPDFNGFVRLTYGQWANSIRDVFELGESPDVAEAFVDDVFSSTFSNNERWLYVGVVQWNDLQSGAEQIAELVTSDAEVLSRLGGVTSPSAFIQKVGKRAFRRPLTEAEIAAYEAIWNFGADHAVVFSSGDAAVDGARLFIEALLQSPHFLYRIQSTEEGMRLSGFELATKLSLLLLNTTPSDALLQAAETGALDTDEGIVQFATEMLSGKDAMETMQRFHSELYRLTRYRFLYKDENLFPDITESTSASLVEADQRFFDHIFAQSSGIREILLSTTAFIDAFTASYYDLAPPKSGFQQVEIQSRPGYLSHLGFLAANAGSFYPDPIARGNAILMNVMCMDLSTLGDKPFPPPRELPPGTTNREAVTSLTEEPACATCHQVYIDPLGFAFEHYDAMGQQREIDNGVAVDTVASYTFDSGLQTFANSQELIGILAEEPVVHRCYSAKMAEFVLARDLASSDEGTIDQTGSRSLEEDSSMQELVLSLVTDPLFTHAQRAN